MPGCKGLSGPVSPKFMVGFLSRVHDGGPSETRGNQPTHEEKTPNSDWAPSASPSPSCPRESLSRCTNQIRTRAAASRRPGTGAAHTSKRGRAKRAAARRIAPGSRSPAASGPLLRRAGHGGDPRTVPGGPVGGRGG